MLLGTSWGTILSSGPGDLFKAQSKSLPSLPTHGSSLFGLCPMSWCPCPRGGSWCTGLRTLGWAVEAVPCPPTELFCESSGKAGKIKVWFQDLSYFRARTKLPQQLLGMTGICKSLGAGNTFSKLNREVWVSAQLLWCPLSAAAGMTDVLQ